MTRWCQLRVRLDDHSLSETIWASLDTLHALMILTLNHVFQVLRQLFTFFYR